MIKIQFQTKINDLNQKTTNKLFYHHQLNKKAKTK